MRQARKILSSLSFIYVRVTTREVEKSLKEAGNSFSFFQTKKHILSLDTVRVIISRRNLARVLSTCPGAMARVWRAMAPVVSYGIQAVNLLCLGYAHL